MSTNYIKNGSIQHPASRQVVNLAKKGWNIKQQINDLQDQLNAVNQKIIDAVPAGCTVVLDGVVQIPVAETERLSVKNPDAVRSLLGSRFDDLVVQKTSYTLSPKLKQMVLSGDDPDGMSVRRHIQGKTTVALRYIAAKPVMPKVAAKAIKKKAAST